LSPVTTLDGFDVLIVDDDEDTRELFAAVLVDEGAAVRTAANAEQALERMKEKRPDVMISDITLPDEDGYSLLRRALAIHPTLPAIAIAGYTSGDYSRRASEVGYQLYLAKPVKIEDLVAAVFRFATRGG
jgi:CheY-like chemotaxis protein